MAKFYKRRYDRDTTNTCKLPTLIYEKGKQIAKFEKEKIQLGQNPELVLSFDAGEDKELAAKLKKMGYMEFGKNNIIIKHATEEDARNAVINQLQAKIEELSGNADNAMVEELRAQNDDLKKIVSDLSKQMAEILKKGK